MLQQNKAFHRLKVFLADLFTKKNRQTFIHFTLCFRYDARSANATSWSEDPPHGFGHRAHFDATATPALLFLDHITHNEGGTYRCRVDFKTSQTRNFILNLNIIGK